MTDFDPKEIREFLSITPDHLEALFDSVEALAVRARVLGLPSSQEVNRLLPMLKPFLTDMKVSKHQDLLITRIIHSSLKDLGAQLEFELLQQHGWQTMTPLEPYESFCGRLATLPDEALLEAAEPGDEVDEREHGYEDEDGEA